MDCTTTEEGLGDGGLGSCVTLIGSFLGEDDSLSGVEGIGIIISSPCSPRERYNMGRISVRTGAGKFFKKCGDIMLLTTATHFRSPAKTWQRPSTKETTLQNFIRNLSH